MRMRIVTEHVMQRIPIEATHRGRDDEGKIREYILFLYMALTWSL